MDERLKIINNTVFYRYYPVNASPFEVSFDLGNKYGKGIYFLDNSYYYENKFKDGMLMKIKPKLKNPKFYTKDSFSIPNSEYSSDIIKYLKEDIRTKNEITNKLIQQGYDSIIAIEPEGVYLVMFYNNPDNYEVISDKRNMMAIGGEIKPLNFVSDSIVSAIEDLLTHEHFGNLTPSEALFFYNKFKNKEQTKGTFLSKEGVNKEVVLELIEQKYIDESWLVNFDNESYDDFYMDSDSYSATNQGIKFLNAIEARIKTRVAMKDGSDLFPESSSVKEYNERVEETKGKLSKLISLIPENK